MKILSKTLLALYLLVLLWLVMFKFSLDLPAALSDNHLRNLNLIPFANYSEGNVRELIYNFLVFIPFGLLLSVNYKRSGLLNKLAIIFFFSLIAESLQYAIAIGAADITDLISNSVGGLLGLWIYELLSGHINTKKLDKFVTVFGSVLLISSLAILGILFASGVRFQPGKPVDDNRMQPPRQHR